MAIKRKIKIRIRIRHNKRVWREELANAQAIIYQAQHQARCIWCIDSASYHFHLYLLLKDHDSGRRTIPRCLVSIFHRAYSCLQRIKDDYEDQKHSLHGCAPLPWMNSEKFIEARRAIMGYLP